MILACPPSANALTRNVPGRGRVRTRAYRKWIQAHLPLVRLVGDREANRSETRVTMIANIDRRRDLDNLIKPVLDLLVAGCVIADDRWVDEILIRRGTLPPKGGVDVKIARDGSKPQTV